MTVTFLYWAPSDASIAGHTALLVNGQCFAFAPEVSRADDHHGATPGYINRDFALEKFEKGLALSAIAALKRDGKNIPAGIQVFRILYEKFNDIKNAQLEELSSFFSEIDPQNQVLGETRADVMAGCVALASWVRDSTYTRAEIIDKGEPTQALSMDFLDAAAIMTEIAALEALQKNGTLLWYGKVGEETDRALNRNVKLRIPEACMKEAAGLHRYVPGKIRHSCSSSVFHLLKVGGIEAYLKHFEEKKFIAADMRAMVQRTAAYHNQTPNQKNLDRVQSMPQLCMALGVFGYGNKPIADWFGTSPGILAEMVAHAIHEHANPRKESRCMVM